MNKKLNFSVLNSTQINRSPLNRSPAKQQYSFSKTQRFPVMRPECPQYTYNLPGIRDTRATTQGVGRKYDFTKNSIHSPGPVVYNKKSDFDKDRSLQKGKTFGYARSDMPECGIITQGVIKNPGVGNYNINRNLTKNSYTMRIRTIDNYNPVFLQGKRSFQEVPGPGTYENLDSLKKDGKHLFSKYKSSGCTTINPAKSQRFVTESNYTPAPNHYHTLNQSGIQGNSKYTLSKYRSFGTRAFGHEKMQDFASRTASLFTHIPGPGNYRLPSEFGNYDHVDFHRTQSPFSRSLRQNSTHR